MARCGDSWLRLLFCLLGAVQSWGCATPAPSVFGRNNASLVWPKPPRQARIAYVGEISTSADLKAGKDPFAAISEVAFGKPDAKGMLAPMGLCTDDSGRLFVADPGAQTVHVFDLNRRKYAQWKPPGGVPFTQPVGVAWDPGGRLIVSDSVSGRLFTFDANGKYLGEIAAGIVQRPAGIAIDRVSRNILVADVAAHQIVVLSPVGEVITRIGHRGSQPGEFNYPTNVVVDRQGYVYVTDALNFRVQTFGPDFKPVRSLGKPGDAPGYFGQPKGIALDGDDHLYVVDARQELVQIFDVGRRLLLFFGGEGRAPGEFWLPAGICIDAHNRIWIADTYNRRVCVFDYLPEKQP